MGVELGCFEMLTIFIAIIVELLIQFKHSNKNIMLS